jgi:hypothetical protein
VSGCARPARAARLSQPLGEGCRTAWSDSRSVGEATEKLRPGLGSRAPGDVPRARAQPRRAHPRRGAGSCRRAARATSPCASRRSPGSRAPRLRGRDRARSRRRPPSLPAAALRGSAQRPTNYTLRRARAWPKIAARQAGRDAPDAWRERSPCANVVRAQPGARHSERGFSSTVAYTRRRGELAYNYESVSADRAVD